MAAIVLHVDDSSDDLTLTQFACAAAGVSFEVRSVESGEKAIAYLEGSQIFADRTKFPLPDLILLDLKMPGKSGFDVLAWIRSHSHQTNVPVIIFTGSVHAEDRLRATELGANQFWVKPADYEALQQLMRTLDRQLTSGTQVTFASSPGPGPNSAPAVKPSVT